MKRGVRMSVAVMFACCMLMAAPVCAAEAQTGGETAVKAEETVVNTDEAAEKEAEPEKQEEGPADTGTDEELQEEAAPDAQAKEESDSEEEKPAAMQERGPEETGSEEEKEIPEPAGNDGTSDETPVPPQENGQDAEAAETKTEDGTDENKTDKIEEIPAGSGGAESGDASSVQAQDPVGGNKDTETADAVNAEKENEAPKTQESAELKEDAEENAAPETSESENTADGTEPEKTEDNTENKVPVSEAVNDGAPTEKAAASDKAVKTETEAKVDASVVTAAAKAKKEASAAAQKIKSMILKVIDYGGKGYGDSQMLISGGRNLLIDTYERNSWNNVNSWLSNNGYREFDIYISHYHDDHMDNVTRILNDGKYKVSTLYLPDRDYMTGSSSYMRDYISMCNDLVSTAKRKGVKIVYLKKGSKFSIGDVNVNVLWGTDYSSGNHDTHYINNNSLVTRFTCGNTRYLNAGDIEAVVERQILKAKVDVKADILKLSHHGGDTSNTEAFIKAVDPVFCYYNYMGDSPSDYAGDDYSSWANKGVRTAEKYANVSSVRYNGDITYRVYDDVIVQDLKRNYTQQKVRIYNKKDKTKLEGITVQRLNKKSWKHPDVTAAKGGYTSTTVIKKGTHADDGWLIGNGKPEYYVKSGKILKGWKKLNGSLYHFDAKTGRKDTGWKTFGNNRFYFYGSGKAAMGFVKIGGKTYHFNGYGQQTKRGWKKIDGKMYCFGSGRELMFGMRNVNGKKYIFNRKTGVMMTGPVTYDGKKYLCGSNGAVQTGGWKTYGGKKYYVDKNTGTLFTGLKKVGKNLYYFKSGGDLAPYTGFVRINGKTYYECRDNRLKTGWLKVKGKMYYMGNNGVMRTGWQTINGRKYRFSSSGVLMQKPEN